jgi:hypothetical protein
VHCRKGVMEADVFEFWGQSLGKEHRLAHVVRHGANGAFGGGVNFLFGASGGITIFGVYKE